MISGFTVLAQLLFLSHSGADAAPQFTLCDTGERTIIHGEVRDDLGFDLSICASGEPGSMTLAIRWHTEGGGSQVICTHTECDGVIEYARYTSPHLTILDLAWRDGKATHRLTQTLNRPQANEAARSAITHSWQTAGTPRERIAGYAVETTAGPLALMELEGILENKPWNTELLSGEEP